MSDILGNVRIGWKLTLIPAVMGLFVVLVALIGYRGMTNVGNDLESIYNDRAVPQHLLYSLLNYLHHGQDTLTRAVAARAAAEIARGTREVEEIDRMVDQTWSAYLATYLTGEEKRLADVARTKLDAFRSAGVQALGLARSGDADAAARKLASDVDHLFDDTVVTLDTLHDLQQREAKSLFDSTQGTRKASEWVLLIVTAVSVLVGSIVALLISRSITGPLGGAVAVMGELTRDNTACTITGANRRDEVGAIARSLEVFRDAILERRRLRDEQEQAKASAETQRRQGLDRLAAEFEQSVMRLVQAVSAAAQQARGNAQGLAKTTAQTREQSLTVAAAAEQASVNVQTVASATEELSGSIEEISRQVTESAKVARQAVDQASRTNGTVAGLSEAAGRIGDVVKLICGIASQTNLLALNATIEAARAGDAGKGFAVVASEVKNLANQTSKATEEIEAQIGNMQSVTAEAVRAIQEISNTIARINEIAAGIASAVEEQGAATREIARNIQQASVGTRQVSGTIDGVTHAAAEGQTMAAEVLTAADGLTRQAGELGQHADGFVRRVRAG